MSRVHLKALLKNLHTFSFVALSAGLLNAAFSKAKQESKSLIVSGRVYGCSLPVALFFWSSGIITNCLLRSLADGSSTHCVSSSECSVASLLGDSVIWAGDAVLSCWRSRGIVAMRSRW